MQTHAPTHTRTNTHTHTHAPTQIHVQTHIYTYVARADASNVVVDVALATRVAGAPTLDVASSSTATLVVDVDVLADPVTFFGVAKVAAGAASLQL